MIFMMLKYRLDSGKILHCFVNDVGYVTVYESEKRSREVAELRFDPKDPDPVVEYLGNKIHLNNYVYMPVDEMVAKLAEASEKQDRWFVSQSDGLATIMGDTENVGFVMEVDCYETIVPGLGLALKSTGGPKVETLMIPVEDRWRKKDWHYKIELMPADEELRRLTGKKTMYFPDFWDFLMPGFDGTKPTYKMVNRKKYEQEHHDSYRVVRDGMVSVFNI